MMSYYELKAYMQTIQGQIKVTKKNKSADTLKEVKRLCKEFSFMTSMLKGSLAEGSKKQ